MLPSRCGTNSVLAKLMECHCMVLHFQMSSSPDGDLCVTQMLADILAGCGHWIAQCVCPHQGHTLHLPSAVCQGSTGTARHAPRPDTGEPLEGT